ncbi:hypothetical protein CP02DC14_2023, partial [Chlamydia psittaci 02DC14]
LVYNTFIFICKNFIRNFKEKIWHKIMKEINCIQQYEKLLMNYVDQ